jgi:hypothetical protein
VNSSLADNEGLGNKSSDRDSGIHTTDQLTDIIVALYMSSALHESGLDSASSTFYHLYYVEDNNNYSLNGDNIWPCDVTWHQPLLMIWQYFSLIQNMA